MEQYVSFSKTNKGHVVGLGYPFNMSREEYLNVGFSRAQRGQDHKEEKSGQSTKILNI